MLFLWYLILGLLYCRVFVGAKHEIHRPPNIVFILTDDQDLRMRSLDHMPKVRRLLIEEGTSYTRHYAPTALCCPARVSLMTGLYAHNHHVTDVDGVNGGWKQVLASGLNDNYLPIWLRRAGYRTYYTGKLYNGMKKSYVEERTARGWTEADLLVGGNTYQYYNPPFQHIAGNWDDPYKIKIFHDEYTTDKVGDYAAGYLEEALKDEDVPFFIGIAPISPHSQVGDNPGPPVPAKHYSDALPNASVPRAENFNPEKRSGVNLVWELERLNDKQVGILDHHYRRRAQALLSVDDLVEKVVGILEAHKQLENTYIIYTSDNGFHLGHHRLGIGKKFAFEEDINVPLIIVGPGVPKNRTTDIVSGHVDIAPTILKMARAAHQPEFDGSPIPYKGHTLRRREAAGSDEHTNVEFWTGATYKMGGFKGRRVNSYKSVRLVGNGYDISYTVQCHNNAHELYDMKKDPVQMRNLHPTAPAPERHQNAFHSGEQKLASFNIKKLLPRIDALLLVLKTCKGYECRRPWKQLHPAGDVKTLRDAMNKKHDHWYHTLPKVRFNRCFKNGTIDLTAEGPQWHGQWRVSHEPKTTHLEVEPAGFYGHTQAVLHDLDEDIYGDNLNENMYENDLDEDIYEDDHKEAESPDGWEGEEGYWDDWE